MTKTNKNPGHSSQGLRQQGVTVIELLIALVVLAVIISIAAPEFTQTINNNRVTTATNEFTTSLAMARSEALKRNSPTLVIPKDDSGYCVNTSGDWSSNGYCIGVNPNNDDDLDDAGSGDVILRSLDPVKQSVYVSSATSSTYLIKFDPLGATSHTGDIHIGANKAWVRVLTINPSGSTDVCVKKKPGDC